MRINHESKGRPAEKKLLTVVVYKKPTGKKYYLLTTESEIDEVLSNSKRKPLIPNNYEIVDMGIGESFIEQFTKQYNIK
jgi:hypothetical protein